MLAGEGNSTNIIFNGINDIYPIHSVIVEEKEDRKKFIKRRVKRLGLMNVMGQVLFQVIIPPLLNMVSRKRIKEIISKYHLDLTEMPADKKVQVQSINNDRVKEILQHIDPDLIIVNGTRIISKKILTTVKCPIINTHAGITPMYRGAHGGYWALAKNDKQNCGVTVHLVDAGIDTGNILYRANIEPGHDDNFVTYPYLQTAKGVALLQKAISDVMDNKLLSVPGSGSSGLWYHPSIWQYLYYRLFKNVK